MTIRTYDSNYLSKASRALGAMLHDAVYQFGMDGGTFLDLFIQSGVAEAFETAVPNTSRGKADWSFIWRSWSERPDAVCRHRLRRAMSAATPTG